MSLGNVPRIFSWRTRDVLAPVCGKANFRCGSVGDFRTVPRSSLVKEPNRCLQAHVSSSDNSGGVISFASAAPGLYGLTLPQLLQSRSALGSSLAPKADHMIVVWLGGGPPHQDMFDMKPDAPAEIRGEYQPDQDQRRGHRDLRVDAAARADRRQVHDPPQRRHRERKVGARRRASTGSPATHVRRT